MIYKARKLIFVLSWIYLSASVQASQSVRTWAFDLKTPGTYEIHVQHKYESTDPPGEIVAKYKFQTKQKIDEREVPITFSAGDGYTVALLRVDVPTSQKVTFTVVGVPEPIVKKTEVYILEADSVSPVRLFNPGNNFELQSAKQIRQFLEKPAADIDLARAKLIIDRHIDPTINVGAVLQKIDRMVAQIKSMPGFGRSKTTDLRLLKRYIYEAGAWNDFQPFQYDLEDPFGNDVRNKLLSNYIATKKGNCVTMPLFFIILGQRLGLDVTASTAPTHIFVKTKDEVTGVWYNLEATSGADPARDVWLREQLPMSDKAVANGLYLRPLTKKETVALMAGTLVEYYTDQKEHEKILTLADLILMHYPKYAEMMITKSNAYFDLAVERYSMYSNKEDIPTDQVGHFEYLLRNNKLWGAKAVDLGWRQPTKEDNEQYVKSVKEAKSKSAN